MITTQAIFKISPLDMKGLVYSIDSFNKEAGTIDVWQEGKGWSTTTVAMYGISLPISTADEEHLRKIFLWENKQSEDSLVTRYRLPRQTINRPNVLVANNVLTQTKQEPAQDIFIPETIAQLSQAKEAPQKAQEAPKQPPQAARAEDVRVERHKPAKRGRKPSVDLMAKLEEIAGELAYLKRAYKEAGFDLPVARGQGSPQENHVKH